MKIGDIVYEINNYNSKFLIIEIEYNDQYGNHIALFSYDININNINNYTINEYFDSMYNNVENELLFIEKYNKKFFIDYIDRYKLDVNINRYKKLNKLLK